MNRLEAFYYLRINQKSVLPNGALVSVKNKEDKQRKTPDSTDLHEAHHVEAAGEIVSASSIPDGTSYGRTIPLGRITPEAAAAADAFGFGGTGWDMFLVVAMLGVSAESARASARAALAGREDYIYEIATTLAEKREIGQGEVNAARARVDRRRRGICAVGVTVAHGDGTQKSFDAESYGGIVMVPGEWVNVTPSKQEQAEKKAA